MVHQKKPQRMLRLFCCTIPFGTDSHFAQANRTEFLTSPRWCTKECLTRKCRAFFGCSILRRHDLVQRRRYSNRAAVRKCCKERHSAAFLSPRESPRWCTKKSRNECCGFFVAPFPPGRTHTSRKRSCSSRGDWSLKMAAGL